MVITNPIRRKQMRLYHRQWYLKHRVLRIQETSIWQKQHRDYLNQLQCERNKRRKVLVFTAYGNKCSCCNESNFGFLTLDHIFNDGYRDKKTVYKTPQALHGWLIKNNFPKDRYRLLCYNCNCGRQWNKGICPHTNS